ncbi:FG-GAP repeat protein [Streptomyces olivaceoviridis]
MAEWLPSGPARRGSPPHGRYTTYNATQADYGATGVIADFDENGYGDLAVSDTPYNEGAGSVLVLCGGASGVATAATRNDRFGHALSAGDTNHDGYPDLAVGVPEEEAGPVENAGGRVEVGLRRATGRDALGGPAQQQTRAVEVTRDQQVGVAVPVDVPQPDEQAECLGVGRAARYAGRGPLTGPPGSPTGGPLRWGSSLPGSEAPNVTTCQTKSRTNCSVSTTCCSPSATSARPSPSTSGPGSPWASGSTRAGSRS